MFLLNCTISFEVFLHCIFHGRIIQANDAVLRDFELWQVVKLKEKMFSSTHKTILKRDFEIYDVSISNTANPTEGNTSHPDKWCNCSKVQDVAVSLLSPEGFSRGSGQRASRRPLTLHRATTDRLFYHLVYFWVNHRGEKNTRCYVLFHRTVPKLRPSRRSSCYVCHWSGFPRAWDVPILGEFSVEVAHRFSVWRYIYSLRFKKSESGTVTV